MKFFWLSVVIIGMWVLIETDAETPDEEIVFKKLGSFQTPGSNLEKSYWVPRYFKAQWQLARPICVAYGLDIVSLDTLEEMEAVSKMCEENRDLFGWFVHIGGMAKTGRSKTDWYWVNANSKVSYNMTWHNGQPDFSGENEWCLSLEKDSQFKFNDITCYGSWEEKFICQSIGTSDSKPIQTLGDTYVL